MTDIVRRASATRSIAASRMGCSMLRHCVRVVLSCMAGFHWRDATTLVPRWLFLKRITKMAAFKNSDGSVMDTTALATFLAVARHGSVTAAALELHTVQSNVTARLKLLETDLDATLFLRHSRGVTLTVAGQRLVTYAQRFTALAA